MTQEQDRVALNSIDNRTALAGLRWRFGYPFAVLVLLVSLGLVFSAWSNARNRELELAESQFHSTVGKLASLVQLRLTSFEITLRGGASLFAALKWPSPEHWRSYADGLALPSRFPSLTGLGFAAYADPAKLARLQLLIRDSGNGRLSVHPHGVRPQYGPIIYLEPHTHENLLALGYDMYSEPVRQAAMRAAMDSGQTRMSGMVHLVQDGGRMSPGLLLYAPVYDTTLPPDNPVQRRRAMKGWVYAPIHVDDMLRVAVAPAKSSERMRVVDVTDPAQVVLYEDPDIGKVNTFTHSLPLSFYGRRWRFDFFSGPEQAAAPQLATVNKLLVAGICASLLLFALAWMLASTEARAQRIALDMTESFRRSEQRFRNSMRYSGIGKALLDERGNVVESNPSFATIVGRDADELIGQPFADLLDNTNETPLRTAQMNAVLDEQDGVVRTTRTLHWRDGELRHVQLVFAPIPRDPGTGVVRLVQVDDVTERVRAEAAVQALNRTLEVRVAARTRELSEANQELESFAYSVSHDLRAPLRAMEGFSRILGERHAQALDETGRDYLLRVRKATARMAELIDALLKLSRIGRSGLVVTDIDFSALAEEVGAGLADTEPNRNVGLHVQPGMRACGDRTLLMTLLDNLMGNAWKFTRNVADPQVEVGMEADADGQPVYFVRDNGAGFDATYADKLFRPFQRLHSQDQFPGHGIGLASVKRIIERHGGWIRASGAAGQGAAFHFKLGEPVEPATTTG
ncbi:CHASE domain-containing protein [Thermomonas sp. HDW16]|uniref:CHASE domain-containing protein n=1 Tax=Thermomonas sp. HDW16 TaxID=2714945 RepID=UPI00140AF13D|nr:CHASE domain-containing protein [Thermomonas sp. HDW16]QIL20675.1 PAS domain S-box protein [Thermomonas sp. HDW16]